jgi:hypothetical protein
MSGTMKAGSPVAAGAADTVPQEVGVFERFDRPRHKGENPPCHA